MNQIRKEQTQIDILNKKTKEWGDPRWNFTVPLGEVFFLKMFIVFAGFFFSFWGNFCCWDWRQKNPLKPYSSGISKVISFCCLFLSFILFIFLFFSQMEFGECVSLWGRERWGSGGLEERAGHHVIKNGYIQISRCKFATCFTKHVLCCSLLLQN